MTFPFSFSPSIGISRLRSCSDFWVDWEGSIYTNVASRRRNAFELLFVLIQRINQIETRSFIEFFLPLCLCPFLLPLLCVQTGYFPFSLLFFPFFTDTEKMFPSTGLCASLKYRCPPFLSPCTGIFFIPLTLLLRKATKAVSLFTLIFSIKFILSSDC